MLRLVRRASLWRKFKLDHHMGALHTLAAANSAQSNEFAVPKNWQWGLLGAIGVIGSTITTIQLEPYDADHPSGSQGFHLLGLEPRRKAFFKYEKRIRELSPPEKVFEYFASQGSLQTGFYMTPGDMMRSVVPVYPPLGSDILRAGSLPGEPDANIPNNDGTAASFLKCFDVDNSGGITFDEWLVFQALLSIPDDDAEVAFMMVDKDSSGKIDKSEFMDLLTSIQARAAKPTPTLRKSSVGNLIAADSGLVTLFFGKDGSGEVTLKEFQNFLGKLRDELVKLEFQFYDYNGKGVLSGANFAHSIAGCARIKHVDEYLTKIDNMPREMAEKQITYEQFVAFRSVWRRLRQLGVALEFRRSSAGGVMQPDFALIAERVLGVKLAPAILDIIYYLFPKEDGSLNVEFMYGVMDRHFETGLVVNHQDNMKEKESGFLACMQKCAAANKH